MFAAIDIIPGYFSCLLRGTGHKPGLHPSQVGKGGGRASRLRILSGFRGRQYLNRSEQIGN